MLCLGTGLFCLYWVISKKDDLFPSFLVLSCLASSRGPSSPDHGYITTLRFLRLGVSLAPCYSTLFLGSLLVLIPSFFYLP
jgi:hypothetical protein